MAYAHHIAKELALPGVPSPLLCEKEQVMKQLFTQFMNDESGQDLIEYALVAALVALGSVAAMNSLSNSIANTFNGVGTALANAV